MQCINTTARYLTKKNKNIDNSKDCNDSFMNIDICQKQEKKNQKDVYQQMNGLDTFWHIHSIEYSSATKGSDY